MSIDLRAFESAVPDRVVVALGGARGVLVATHENPDADTLGAALAVAVLVESSGGRATVVCSDPVPAMYAFMPGIERVRLEPEDGIAYDLLVACDCGTLDRVGPVRDRHRSLFDRLPLLVIDHHASNESVGSLDWIDPDSAATCEMVALLAGRLGVSFDAGTSPLATVLLAGIVMDTATFAHPNATPRTLAVSAALVEAGAPLSDISRRLYRTKPHAQLRLFGRVLDRLETVADGRIVWSTLMEADLLATGSPTAHSEGIIDLLAQSERAEVAILFKETGVGTRISVRTKAGGIDATVLAARFGGGGHARAAGATILKPLDEARREVLAEAERLVSVAG